MQIVLALILLSVLVMFHELGHFLAGKAIGVYVHEFAIGMGPLLYSKKGKETKFSLRLIPMGGYTLFAGEEGKDKEEDAGIPPERLMTNQTPGHKALIVTAGPLANLLIAALAFTLVFGVVGLNLPTTAISEVMAGYPAEAAGLQVGDQIISVSGIPTNTWDDMTAAIQPNAGKPIEVVVKRGDETLLFTMTALDVSGVGVIGVRPAFESKRIGLARGLVEGLKETVLVTVSWVQGIFGMIVGTVAPDVTGPVGITQILGEAAATGLSELLYLLGAFSANLGLFNLLPIPALDGSRLVFALIEAVTGKPVNPERESFVHFIGFFLLMVLFVVITYKDIIRLVQ